MSLPSSVNELEGAPEGLAKARGIVSHHGQAAASFWPIEREGGDDGIASELHAPLEALDISSAVAVLGEEVKGRPIVPNIVCPGRIPRCHVSDNPMNLSSTGTKTGLGRFQRSLG